MPYWVRRSDAKLEIKSPRKMADAYGLVFTNPDGTPNGNASWILEPDRSAVTGFPTKYWVKPVVADTPALLNQAERDAVDAAEIVAGIDNIADEIDQAQTYSRAFAEIVLDEFNSVALKINEILDAIDAGANAAQIKSNIAAVANRPQRTLSQLKTALRGKL